MVRIAPIKLQYNPKVLWFDSNGFDIVQGDAVVVNTVRGIEFGYATKNVFEAEEADVEKLKSELKKVKRLATPQDIQRSNEMQERSREALPVFKEMVFEAQIDMQPVSVEFLLDGDKAVFYFEAEERVDFRDLVRKLASHFHVRIDMRQIGVRDEARIIGGLGHFGQELCCKRLGGEFNPVSIRMAKEQDLSLNPQKISGLCGRLMCCLRYEFDAYKDFHDRAPKLNAKIETPEGQAKVVNLNVPKELITLLLDDDKKVKIPLAEMESSKKGERPNRVSKQAFERFANQNILDTFDSVSALHIDGDTRQETPVHSQKQSDSAKKSISSDSTRRPRRRTKVTSSEQNMPEQTQGEKKARSPRRRNSRKKQGQQTSADQQPKQQSNTPRKGDSVSSRHQAQAHRKGSNTSSQGQIKKQSSPASRPGQHSSGLRKESNKSSQAGPQSTNNVKNKGSHTQKAPSANSGGRKVRRSHRSHSGSDSSEV